MIEFQPDRAFDPSLCDDVLTHYADGSSHTQVAVKLGISRQTFNAWRSQHTDFDAACEYGESLAEAALEDIALQGAKGEIRNFNNTILQFILKARHRKTYGDLKDDKSDEGTLLEQLAAGSLKIVRSNE